MSFRVAGSALHRNCNIKSTDCPISPHLCVWEGRDQTFTDTWLQNAKPSVLRDIKNANFHFAKLNN